MLFLRCIILLSLFLLTTNSALACMCAGSPPLIQLVESGRADYLIRARVEAYDVTGTPYARSMTVTILEELRGEIEAESLIVFGDDGGSCSPFVTNYAVGKEWLLPLFNYDGRFIIAACAPLILVEDEDVVGLVSPRSCSQSSKSSKSCFGLSQAEQYSINQARMTLVEFKAELELYTDAVAWAIEMCSGPWPRCEHLRASYDSDSGELSLPSIDIKRSFFGNDVLMTTGVESWNLKRVEGSEDSYIKVEDN